MKKIQQQHLKRCLILGLTAEFLVCLVVFLFALSQNAFMPLKDQNTDLVVGKKFTTEKEEHDANRKDAHFIGQLVF